MHLTRILADSFGMQRPLCCVLAGPSARLCMVPTHLRGLANGQTMLTPVREFIDGHTVIETAPPTPVDLFHLCLARHAVIQVGGLEFETYHPGPNAGRFMSHAMRSVFLNLFAHVDQISGFGPLAHPRIEDDDTDRLIA